MNPFARILKELPQATQELDLLPKIEQLANAADPSNARQIMEASPALLGELASSLLLELISEARRQGSEAIAQTLEETLALLQTARAEGIEQAFIEAGSPPDAVATSFGEFTDVPAELAQQVQNALALQAIYGVARQPQDLDEAADRWRGIVAHPAFAAAPVVFRLQASKSAALTLTRRCEQSAPPGCQNEAIDLWRSAVLLSGDDVAERAACLTYLGHVLRARAAANPSGAPADIDEAVAAYREARQLAPASGQSALATNLAAGLHVRYQLTGADVDLDEAIDLYQGARRSLRLYARSAPEVLDDLGSCLLARYRLRGDPHDLAEAISALRLAAQRTPPDSTRLTDRLHRFALALTERYDLTRDAGDLNEAIESLHAAIQLAPPGHRDLQRYAESLGACLRRYYASAGLEV